MRELDKLILMSSLVEIVSNSNRSASKECAWLRLVAWQTGSQLKEAIMSLIEGLCRQTRIKSKLNSSKNISLMLWFKKKKRFFKFFSRDKIFLSLARKQEIRFCKVNWRSQSWFVGEDFPSKVDTRTLKPGLYLVLHQQYHHGWDFHPYPLASSAGFDF